MTDVLHHLLLSHRLAGRVTLASDLLVLPVHLEDLQKLLVRLWLVGKAIFDLVEVLDGVVEFAGA
jgi:hypothetical protein